MKTFLLTLLTITTLSSISFGQAPPNYMVMTNPNTNAVVNPTNTWNIQYNYSLAQTTTNITGATPEGMTGIPSFILDWCYGSLPSGTKFHTYNSEELVVGGAFAGKPKMSMQIIEFPDGTMDLASIAHRNETGNIAGYFADHSSSPPDYAGVTWGWTPVPSDSLFAGSFAIVYPGGGFGPAYTPSMALPLASTIDLVALQAKATDLGEGLEFLQGYWRPINP